MEHNKEHMLNGEEIYVNKLLQRTFVPFTIPDRHRKLKEKNFIPRTVLNLK